MRDFFLRIGVVAAGTAVALGAFGAHGLRSRVPAADLGIFETGVRYQMYHGLALLAIGALSAEYASPWLGRASWAFTAGMVVFSGSLYLLVLTGARWWGAVTPIGGVAFLVGWLSFGLGLWKGRTG